MGPFAAAYVAYNRGKVLSKYDIDSRTMEFLTDAGFVTRGDHILITMGTLIGKAGATNSIKLLSIG